MSQQQFIKPTISTTDDSTYGLNVLSTTPGGAVQIVTTGETVVTHEADRHVVVGDMIIGPGHNKTVPTNLYVTGDITIEKTDNIPFIADETIENKGILYVDGNIACLGNIDVNGDLIFEDSAIADDSIKAGSENEIGWLPIESGEFVGSFYKQVTFTNPFSDANYVVTVQAIEYFDGGFLTAIEKTVNGFKIATVTTPTSAPDKVDWMAIKY